MTHSDDFHQAGGVPAAAGSRGLGAIGDQPRTTARGTPLLDTRLRKVSTGIGRKGAVFRDRRSGKLWARSKIGMLFPGNYFFVTFTSSKESPKIEKSWIKLRWWLKRQRKGIAWLYCITTEGLGVLHMIIRLPKSEARLEQSVLQEYWLKIHKAWSVIIKKVKNYKGLSDYLADQNRKSSISAEMYHQPGLVRYRMGSGWVPVGFMKVFGRFWFNCRSLPGSLRDQVLREWLFEIEENVENMKNCPHLDCNNVLIR